MLDLQRIRRLVESSGSSTTASRSLYADIGLAVVALSVTWTIVGTPVAALYLAWEGASGVPGAYDLYGSVLLGAFERPFFWMVAAAYPLVLARVMPDARAFAIAFGVLTVIRGLASMFQRPGETLGILLAVYLLVALFAWVLSRLAVAGGGLTSLPAASPDAEPAADGGQRSGRQEDAP